MNSSAARVLCEVRDHIAYVTMNRADKLNGLDMAMFNEMIATAKKIRKDRSVRVVVLAANGDSFCAGLDFKAVSKNPSMIARISISFP